MELRYFRDAVTGREIDFVVLKEGVPIFAVEAKSGERDLSHTLLSFGKKLRIPALYQVHLGERDYGTPSHGRLMPFAMFCEEVLRP